MHRSWRPAGFDMDNHSRQPGDCKRYAVKIMSQLDRIRQKISSKGLRLNPPASLEAVVAFESKHGVALPQGYRDFVTQIGDGGVGPLLYGMVPFGDLAGDAAALANIRKPFPFTRAWVWEAGEVSDEGTEEQILNGSLCLGEDGCGMMWHLIVTGLDAGIPWALTDVGIGHVVPKRDFLQWYEDWLDGRDSFYGMEAQSA